MTFLSRLRRTLIMALAGAIILVAILVGIGRFAFELFPGIQDEAQLMLADSLGREVKIGELGLGWTRWSPSVQMQQVVIMNEAGDSEWLRFDEMSVGVSVLGLMTGTIQPTELRVQEPVLDLSGPAAADDGSQVEDEQQTTEAEDSLKKLGKTLGRLGRLVIENGELHLPDPWNEEIFLRLTEVNVELSGSKDAYALTGSALLPPIAGGEITFNVDAIGSFRDPAKMRFVGTANAADPEPAFWLRPLFRAGSRVDFSKSSIALGFEGNVRQLGKADLTLLMNDVSVDNGPVFWRETVFRAQAEPVDERDINGWRVAINEFTTTAPQEKYGPATGEVRVQSAPLRLDVLVESLDFAAWAPWFQIVRPFAGVPDPARLRPAGVVEKMLLAVREVKPEAVVETEVNGQGPDIAVDPESEYQYASSVELDGLVLGAVGDIPGLAGISGSLNVNNSGGSFILKGESGHVHLPAVFGEIVPFNTLTGVVAWQQQSELQGWRITASDINARMPGEMHIHGGMTLDLPEGDRSSPIDLDMRFTAANVMPAKALIPIDPEVFPVEVQTWLRDSILGGQVSDGRVQIRGALSDFPYQNENEPGLFRVDFNLNNGQLRYAEDWPGISAIAGRLVFQGRTMDIQADSAGILGVPVGPVHVWIKDYHEAVLYVDGKASAPAPAMLGFLRESPLNEEFEHMLSVLDLQGDADLALDLNIPLDDLEATKVNGRIDLAGNELHHSALPRPLQDINGNVDFDNDGVRAKGLQGNLFNQPVSVDLAPRVIQQGGEEVTVIDVTAKTSYSLPADRDAVAEYVPLSIMQNASGRAGLQMKMGIVDSPEPTPIRLNIDLTQMALNLPPPVGKNVGAPQKLTVEMLPRQQGGADLQADYQGLATARLRWGGTPEVWKLDRGLIRVGGKKVTELPKESGLWLEGQLDELDLGAWRTALTLPAESAESATTGAEPDAPAELPIRGAELRLGQLRVAGQSFSDVRAQINRHQNQWWALLDSPGIRGTIEWPANQARPVIKAEIENLSLGTLSEEDESQKETTEPPIDPAVLPGLHLDVAKITLNKTGLGKAKVLVDPVSGGLRLRTVEITGPGVDINGSGEWMRDAAGSTGRVTMAVSGNRIESVLAAAGYEPTLTAKKTDISMNLFWTPNPQGLVPKSMNGQFKLKLEEGALLAVDPGAGRALGLLNFYALPRRLQFDFEDVTSEGLVFDELKGNFEIVDGNAYTTTLRMEGPSLKMRIKGRTGIAARDYDQIVNIVPNIKSGVTLAGTVLGGPAVGAALLIAQELFEEPLEQVSELQYHLGGSWDEPVVGDVGDRAAPKAPRRSVPDAPGKTGSSEDADAETASESITNQ